MKCNAVGDRLLFIMSFLHAFIYSYNMRKLLYNKICHRFLGSAYLSWDFNKHRNWIRSKLEKYCMCVLSKHLYNECIQKNSKTKHHLKAFRTQNTHLPEMHSQLYSTELEMFHWKRIVKRNILFSG